MDTGMIDLTNYNHKLHGNKYCFVTFQMNIYAIYDRSGLKLLSSCEAQNRVFQE